jgi:hypothetical protein
MKAYGGSGCIDHVSLTSALVGREWSASHPGLLTPLQTKNPLYPLFRPVATVEGSEFESREGQYLSPLHGVQAGSGAQPASYLMGKVGSFPVGKAAGAWSWSLTSN